VGAKVSAGTSIKWLLDLSSIKWLAIYFLVDLGSGKGGGVGGGEEGRKEGAAGHDHLLEGGAEAFLHCREIFLIADPIRR
jgi:hypothetical protein